MKIKIKKNSKVLKERYDQSPSSLMSIEKIFKDLGILKEEAESLFNKDLLFYDLETTGLRRKEGKKGEIADMIHQIAILKYSPNGDPNNINPEKPDDYYVAKANIPQEYSDRSEKVINKRTFMMNQVDKNKYVSIKKEFFENGRIETKINNTGDVKFMLGLFFHVFISYRITNKTKGRIVPRTDSFKDLVLKYVRTIEFSDEENNNTSEKIIETINSDNPTKEELILLYESVFSEDSAVGGISTYYSKRGIKFIKEQVERLIKTIGQTTEENKVFTNYDDFPLKKYQEKDYAGNVSEEEALKGMMKFIDQLGVPSKDKEKPDGDYVLIGQNIISFDNPFVISRCKFHGITNTNNFRDSNVYDTRFLFSLIIKYFETLSNFYGWSETTGFRTNELKRALEKDRESGILDDKREKWYQKSMEEIAKIKKAGKKIKPYANEAKQILISLQKSGKPKGKLETLMNAFISNAPKQTHTADDDCEKLATVFIPAMQKFYEIYEKTYEFIYELDEVKILRILRVIKGSPRDEKGKKTKTLSTQAMSTPGAVGFQKLGGIADIRKKVVDKFVQDLGFQFLRDNNIEKEDAAMQIDEYLKNIENLQGTVSPEKKEKVFTNYLSYTEGQVIEWYKENILGGSNQINESKRTNKIKIKILKENKNGKRTHSR